VKKVGEVANRPQEVVQKVQESAGKIVAMGNGNDENPVARWTQ
jgi:hypothetical protein